MRKLTLIFALLFLSTIQAQSGREAGSTAAPVLTPGVLSISLQNFMDEAKRRSIYPNLNPKSFTGSYYLTEDFKQGKLKMDNKEVRGFFRYNVLSNEMELKLKKDSEIIALPGEPNTIYNIDGKIFNWENIYTEDGWKKGYFIKLFDGDEVKFYGLPVLSVRQAKKAKSGYDEDKPAHYEVKLMYYLSKNNFQFHTIRIKNKDFKKSLDLDARSKDYLDEHKLKKVADVIEFLEFYEAG